MNEIRLLLYHGFFLPEACAPQKSVYCICYYHKSKLQLSSFQFGMAERDIVAVLVLVCSLDVAGNDKSYHLNNVILY